MYKRNKNTFYCFSPPVMVATMIIEFSLALYAVLRYKMTTLGRLIVIDLLCLGIFQVAEYSVCTNYGHMPVAWSKLGFLAITALPPLGLHILHLIANKPIGKLVKTSYLSMLGFFAYFMLAPNAFGGHECTGNYVIFQLGRDVGGIHAMYYYVWLFSAMALGIQWANEFKRKKAKKFWSQIQAVRAMIIGYLVFLVPTAVAINIQPEARRGIPSVMCGFAVIFALILTLYVLPRSVALRESPAKSSAHA